MSTSFTVCHYCLSISCLPEGEAGGVLLRALDPLEGFGTMARLRGVPSDAKPKMLTEGPGRLCQAIGITRAIGNGLDVTQSCSTLQIADDGNRPDQIETTPRVGIRKAVDRPLRFLITKGEKVIKETKTDGVRSQAANARDRSF